MSSSYYVTYVPSLSFGSFDLPEAEAASSTYTVRKLKVRRRQIKSTYMYPRICKPSYYVTYVPSLSFGSFDLPEDGSSSEDANNFSISFVSAVSKAFGSGP